MSSRPFIKQGNQTKTQLGIGQRGGSFNRLWDLSVEGSTALPFFPIHFPVITRAPIGQNGKLELKTNNGLTKHSEFAEFNS